jgi:arylsulfatase A-like enzyme
VHDEGPYKIRPLPIPRSDGGSTAKELTRDDPTPGGGNLFLRGAVFDRVGLFQTALGPHGHDLGGGEDSAFVQEAFVLGERLMYIPGVLQYHHVDKDRLRLRYLLRKAYQRSRTSVISRNIRAAIPAYLWRKLGQNIVSTVFSLDGARFRFHLVRIATTLGEISGFAATRRIRSSRREESRRNAVFSVSLLGLVSVGTAAAFIGNVVQAALVISTMLLSAAFTAVLAVKSISDFTHTGPRLKDEILAHYKRYTVFAFLRLLIYAFVILCALSLPGIVVYFAYSSLTGTSPKFAVALIAGTASILSLVGLQFSRHLLLLPANITASYNYRASRLYPYWQRLSPVKLKIAAYLLLGAPAIFVAYTAVFVYLSDSPASATAYTCALLFYVVLGLWVRSSEPMPVKISPPKSGLPNIVMIGSDTLRADRIDGSYSKDVAPHLNRMTERGTLFGQCHVPCARTAPSLLALLTGTWPHRFGVRDNFVPDEATRLSVATLPRILKNHGYYTAALSDWCGADMGKFDLGFDYADVPEDQWNVKLFIRQGPKDLRLFLSLFARNRLGKIFLPEIHYLGGVPQTDELGLETRHLINHLATGNRPFFLNVFFSTTHGPFGSEYPYYTRFTRPDYKGESKFVMARVTDPWEIIRRQAEPRAEFDLDQIINLYDGCVTRFDDEVGRIMSHLEQCGLADNTIVVVYSDHGMEFFEHHTWGQGNSAISDVSNRIPLLIFAPGVRQGRTVTQPVRSIDLAPTLLDLAGINPTPGMDGASLKPSMLNSTIAPDLDVFSETGIWLTDLPGTPVGHLRYPNLLDLLTVRNIATGTISVKPEFEEIIVRAKDRSIRNGRWKLVYQPLQEAYLLKLFDAVADPDCLHDVHARYPDVAQDMWGRLQEWMLGDPLMNPGDAASRQREIAHASSRFGDSRAKT